MTDQPLGDEALTPAQEERVRRLLADARHTAPMPAEVADRLDAVVRELAAEREDGPVTEPGAASHDDASSPSDTMVVSLDAARRRRRRTSGLLVAAAAVLAIGVGVPAWVNSVGTGSADESTAGSAAAGAADNAAPEMAAGGDASTDKGANDGPQRGDSAYAAEAPRVAASRFRRDAIRLADQPAALTSGSAGSEPRSKSLFELVGCTRADDWGPGEEVAVLFEDAPALMIYRDPVGGLQQVDLYRCDSTQPALTTQIPAP